MSDESKSFWKNVVDFPANVRKSIFRNPLPSSDRGRAATSFSNLFLHIQPVRVSRQALRPTYTMGLGLISFFLFVILTLTGVLLMFYYVPSTTQAYGRMLDLRSSVAFGVILRNMHRWAAHAMVAVVFLHMCRVFFTGSYKPPREFNWLIGVALFLLTLLIELYRLSAALGSVGVLGHHRGHLDCRIRAVHRQGTQVHAARRCNGRPGGAVALLRSPRSRTAPGAHIVCGRALLAHPQRRWTGQAQEPEALPVIEIAPAPEPVPAMAAAAGTSAEPARRFSLQGLVRGPFVKVDKIDPDTVFSWPNLLIAELFVLLLTIAGVMLVSILFNAPLEQPVNVMHPPNPAKAPWYFLGLQEQVSYSAFWGGIGVPGIELLLLVLLPFFDRGKAGVGRWFARERVLANSIFLLFVIVNVILIVIGTFFRGANWQFVSPF